MSIGDQVRKQVDDVLFPQLGSDAQLQKKQTSYNSRGEETGSTYGSGATIQIIPYNFIQDRRETERLGDLDAGDANFAVKYDVDADEGDRVVFDGDTYEVIEVEKSHPGKVVIQVLSVNKIANP